MTEALLGVPPETVRDIGWTLLHFLWQGLVLAALLRVILPMCRSAIARHNWSLGTLAMMAFAPVATFLFLHGHGNTTPSIAFADAPPQGVESVIRMLSPTLIPSFWIDWLVLLWLAGIAALSLRALGGWYLVETLRHRDTVDLSPDLIQRCHSLQRRLALDWPVRFLQSRRVSVLVVVGWFRPVVLIPLSAIAGLPPQQLDALIMHELAHIRRLDAFTNIVILAIETILFYHPAIWWVSSRVRIEREHCCDDLAVSTCGDATIYAEALTSLETWKAAPALALGANGGMMLKERVARLLGVPSEPRRSSVSAMAGLVFICLIIAGIATAQSNAQASSPRFAIRVVDESVDRNARQGPADEDRVPVSKPGNGMPGALWLKRDGQIAGEVIAEAHASTGPDGRPVIAISLTPEGRDRFAALTKANLGHPLAVVVNGTVVAAPVVKEAMVDGKAMISGNYSAQEARLLAVEMMGMNRPGAR